MQTNLSKYSAFFERLLQMFDYYGIKNVNSFAIDYLKYNSSEKINRLRKEENKPSIDIILDISNKFEDINIKWLLTGEGEMLLKKEYKTPEIENIELKEPNNNYKTKEYEILLQSHIELAETIGRLKYQIEEIKKKK